MDPHRLAEERSLAYHAMVSERLQVDDTVVPSPSSVPVRRSRTMTS
jgi:hypothetical protein